MTLVFKVRPKFRNYFNAIVHKDNTARVQTVSKENNFRFWKLLSEYKNVSGHGMLLNTSLNLKEQPIIENPKQAFEIFLNTKTDGIFIGNYYIIKK